MQVFLRHSVVTVAYGYIFGNSVNAAVAAGLFYRRPRGPNLVRVPCETEENEQMVQPKGLTEQ